MLLVNNIAQCNVSRRYQLFIWLTCFSCFCVYMQIGRLAKVNKEVRGYEMNFLEHAGYFTEVKQVYILFIF